MKKIPLMMNTMTNYILMVVNFIQGILIVRWIIASLGEKFYGLWGMLWSFFCYSLLLDFGLGLAAQKATATEMWRKDINRYNRTISTVLSVHLLMSLVIVAGTLIGAYFAKELLHLEGNDLEYIWYYRLCLMICGFGSAIAFPLGVFSEILVGLQKIYLRNYITIGSKLLELSLVLTVFILKRGLISLLISTLSLMSLTSLTYMYFVYRSIPGFTIGLKTDKEIFKEVFHFSGFVTLVSLARMVWERGSVILVSMISGLEMVSQYMLGVKLSVQMIRVVVPYQENVTPISALLYSRGRRDMLSTILLNSMRWNSFLATGMSIGIVIYSRVLVRFLFNVDSDLVTVLSQVSTVAVFLWLVFRNIPEKYMMMSEQHKFVSLMFITEAVLFVLSSLLLMWFTDMNGAILVMCTSIGSRFVCTMFIMLPRFLVANRITVLRLFWQTVGRPLTASLPVIALGCAEYYYLLGRVSDMCLLVIAGASCGPLYLICAFFGMINKSEKKRIPILSKFMKKRRA